MAIVQVSIDTTENNIRHYKCTEHDLIGSYPTDCDSGSTMNVLDGNGKRSMYCLFDGSKWNTVQPDLSTQDMFTFQSVEETIEETTHYFKIDTGNKPIFKGNIVVPIDVAQIETGIVVATNGITKAGNAEVIVTGSEIEGSPITLSVPVEGVKQVESTAVVGTITEGGNVKVTVTADDVTGFVSPKEFSVAVAGTKQIETATVVGTVTGDGDAKVTLTCVGVTGITSPKDYAVAVDDGVAQVETATITGTITTSGNAKVTVTATGVTGFSSPKDFSVAVLDEDTASEVAGKIITALQADSDLTNITDGYTVGGTGADVTLTRKVKVANDTTLNIAYIDDTCVGLTADATSTSTTAGAVADDASAVAEKMRTVLEADTALTNVTDGYVVSGTGADIILTRVKSIANDTTLNIATDNDTCTGLTTTASSVDTEAGVAGDSASVVGGKIRTALEADTDLVNVADGYVVGGTGANITLTRVYCLADDSTLNIAIENDTCSGLTEDLVSANTTAGVLGDSATIIAGKIRTALNMNVPITDIYTIGGSGANVILTQIVPDIDNTDATLNISIANGTCEGIVDDTSSNDTQGADATNKTIEISSCPRECEITLFVYFYNLSTLTFTNVLWNGGTEPTFVVGLNVVKLYTNDGGNTIFGEVVIGANPS